MPGPLLKTESLTIGSGIYILIGKQPSYAGRLYRAWPAQIGRPFRSTTRSLFRVGNVDGRTLSAWMTSRASRTHCTSSNCPPPLGRVVIMRTKHHCNRPSFVSDWNPTMFPKSSICIQREAGRTSGLCRSHSAPILGCKCQPTAATT